eukprot:scaffold22215_cov72-Phaeocystis_antarctica.AAC.1
MGITFFSAPRPRGLGNKSGGRGGGGGGDGRHRDGTLRENGHLHSDELEISPRQAAWGLGRLSGCPCECLRLFTERSETRWFSSV